MSWPFAPFATVVTQSEKLVEDSANALVVATFNLSAAVLVPRAKRMWVKLIRNQIEINYSQLLPLAGGTQKKELFVDLRETDVHL